MINVRMLKRKPSRSVFLTDPEIREFEKMDDVQLSSFFLTNGVQVAAEIVRSIISSYRITAHVAVAAWELFDRLRAHRDLFEEINKRQDLVESLNKLRAALSNFSPGNWPPPRTEFETAAHLLEKLYDEAARRPSWESSIDAIYQAVCAVYNEIA